MHRTRALVVISVLLSVLWVGMTWPQAARMGAVTDEGDPLLNTWALAWVAHQLPRAPARLANANIFYPEKYTLLYSESLILPGVMWAPLAWAHVSPVVVYNVCFMTGLVLSGMGVALLVLELTGDAASALVAAVAFAFLPFRADHYSHLQLQLTQWIPLALWSMHRWVRHGRVADGVWLGVFSACQLYSCTYFGLLMFPFMLACVVVLVGAQVQLSADGGTFSLSLNRRFGTTRLKALVLGMLTYGLLVAPLGVGYARAARVVGERSTADATAGSAHPTDYLAASHRSQIYGGVTERWGGEERRLFPGLGIVVLAALGLRRRRTIEQIAYCVALLVAFDVSLGFNGVTFRLLWNNIGAFRAIRIPARMAMLVGLALSVLAAYGVSDLRRQFATRMGRWLIPISACAVVVLESAVRPLGLPVMPASIPPGYADLLRDAQGTPTAAVADLPIGAGMPTYMYYSTFHWQNLLSGYSGFYPPSYVDLERSLANFPDGESMEALRRRYARYVVVHGEVYRPDEYSSIVARADRFPELALVSKTAWRGAEMSVYRVQPAAHDQSAH